MSRYVQAVLDPCDQYKDMDQVTLIALLGMLPNWASDYNSEGSLTLRDYFQNCYGYPLSYLDEGIHDEDGVFYFPGDPPQYPLCVVEWRTGQKFYIYRHGMVAFFDFDKDNNLVFYHTRMD